MRQSSRRAMEFAQQIRRKDRNELIAQIRSKMIEQEKSQQKKKAAQVTFLDQYFEGTQLSTPFQRIFAILESIMNQYLWQKQNRVFQYDLNILQYILTTSQSNSFKVKIHRYFQLSVNQFKSCLLAFPKLFYMKMNQISINILRLKQNNGNIQQNQLIIQKISKCKIIRIVTQYCNYFLRQFNDIIEDIQCHFKNIQIIQVITDILIQASCFQPRLFRNVACSQLGQALLEQINSQMSILRQSLNMEICINLVPIVSICMDTFKTTTKLLINFFYITGNILININSKSFRGEHQRYPQIKHIVHKKNSQILAYTKNYFQYKNDHQCAKVVQLSSLVIWFTRNQILLSLGLYKTKDISLSNINLDQSWLSNMLTIFDNLQQISYKRSSQNFHYSYNSNELNLVKDLLSLLTLIVNQFTIAQNILDSVVNYIIQIRRHIFFQIQKHNFLIPVFFDLYTSFVHQSHNQAFSNLIKQELLSLARGQKNYAEAFKFCSNILGSQSKINASFQVQVSRQFSNNLQKIFQSLKSKNSYSLNIAFIGLLASVHRNTNILSFKFNVNFDFLSEKRLVRILQMIYQIWTETTRPQDLLQTLNFLLELTQQQQYSDFIKNILESQSGYKEQLQKLTQWPSEEINRKVHQIYQTLDMY